MPGASRWNRRISLCGADASSGAAKKSNSRTSSAGTWDGTDIGHSRRDPHAAATPAIASDVRMFSDSDFQGRSEEHTSELQSLMRISYAVFCLKKKKKTYPSQKTKPH